MSLAKIKDSKISEQEYLAGELISEVKHDYIEGDVYAMAGASRNHDRIAGNILAEFKNDLKQKKIPCDVFSSDMKVKVSDINSNYFYPDVSITCDENNNESESEYSYLAKNSSPVIIVEVLSISTRKYDLATKKLYYFNIPTLQEYVVIEQDICQVMVFRKSENWRVSHYFLGNEITFNSIGTSLAVEDIYYHVNNNDMTEFLKELQEAQEE